MCKLLSCPCQIVNFPETKKREEMTGGRMASQSRGNVNATVQQTDIVQTHRIKPF